MKAYTDLEQSKKLAEILPIESADMHYVLIDTESELYSAGLGEYIGILPHYPCWSLAALLNVLKYPSLTQNVENKWFIIDWTGDYPKSEHGFDSPVDTCYRMIIKLHEQKLL